MEYYCDIKLRQDPDFVPAVLMNALFSKLHRALAEQSVLHVGVSFPEYSTRPLSLGGSLRLHGSGSDLKKLFQQNWLTGMRDHVQYGEVAPVPAEHQHIRVQRVQAKSSPERLARRYARKHAVSMEEAWQKYKTMEPEKLRLPFLTLNSRSTGQRFTLFIEQKEILPNMEQGSFNRYGLSQTATVPWF